MEGVLKEIMTWTKRIMNWNKEKKKAMEKMKCMIHNKGFNTKAHNYDSFK